MKNIMKYSTVMLLLTLAVGMVAFTPATSEVQNEEVFSCYVYKADLTTAKWNEIANPLGYTQYIVIESLPSSGHTITTADYKGDWGALMTCLGLSQATLYIVVDEIIDGT